MAIEGFAVRPDINYKKTFSSDSERFLLDIDDFVSAWNDISTRSPVGGLLSTTSTTSAVIGSGSKSFVLAANQSFLPGMFVMVSSTASPSICMWGTVSSYTARTLTLVINVVNFVGSGTLAAWTISSSAEIGSIGGSLSRCITTGFENSTGTTNTRILRYVTLYENVGSNILPDSTVADGASFTINKDGMYYVAMSLHSPASISFGLSLNSSQLTTDFSAIAASDRLIYGRTTPQAGVTSSVRVSRISFLQAVIS